MNDFFNVKKDISEKKQLVREKGDQKGIKEEIEKLTHESKEYNLTEINTQEINYYNDLAKKITDIREYCLQFNADIHYLEQLKKLSLFKDNVKYEINSITSDNRLLVESLFNEIKKESIERWLDGLNELIQNLNSKVTDFKDMEKTLSNDPVFVKLVIAYAENEQLKQLDDRIKIEKNKLFDSMILYAELLNLTLLFDDLKKKIISTHNLFYEKIQEVIPKLSISNEGLDINAKIKFNTQKYRRYPICDINFTKLY